MLFALFAESMVKIMSKKYKRVSGSLMGKTATIVACEDRLEIYTTGTWLIILCLWILAAAMFWLSLYLNNYIISIIFTLIGGISGYIIASKLYLGKLTETFEYKDVTCFMYTAPEFTVVKSDNYLFGFRLLPKSKTKLIANLTEAFKDNKNYTFVSKNGKYYVEPKRGTKE